MNDDASESYPSSTASEILEISTTETSTEQMTMNFVSSSIAITTEIFTSWIESTETDGTSARPMKEIEFEHDSIGKPHVLAIAQHFALVDYILFIIMLGLSALIGVYFGFISKRKQNNTTEYLFGGKQMNFFPIAASLIASHVSGITLLGVPAEIYGHGTQYWMHIISAFTVGAALLNIYLPVFYDLQLTSSFTYLELRFDRRVRSLASCIYIISCITFVPIIVYVPALALSQVSGINLHYITFGTSIVCIFYTTVGGLKAVVWTDTLQFILMIGATLIVIFLGLSETGGLINVWQTADKGGRLIFFNMDPSPFVRASFWTVSLGLTTIWVSNMGVNQGCVQRFLAVPDIHYARKSVWVFVFGLIFIKACSCITGLIMYAKYETCDPISTKQVTKLDQMLPFFVMDVAEKIPGLPGVFVAGIFSAALSSMSSSLNTLSGAIYEDFIRRRYPRNTEKQASNIMKILVIVLGFVVLGLVFVVERMGQIFQVAIVIAGLTGGTLLGMFTIGMTSRTVNTRGVITGAYLSMLIVGIIMIGSQFKPKFPLLPVRTDGCDESMNSTMFIKPDAPVDMSHIPWVFRISFMYLGLMGMILLCIIAYIVSWFTGGTSKLDERLFAPFCRRTQSTVQKPRDSLNNVKYNDIDHALNDLTNHSLDK